MRIPGLDEFVGVGDSNTKKRAIINSALDICHKLVRAGLMNSKEISKVETIIFISFDTAKFIFQKLCFKGDGDYVSTSDNHLDNDLEGEMKEKTCSSIS